MCVKVVEMIEGWSKKNLTLYKWLCKANTHFLWQLYKPHLRHYRCKNKPVRVMTHIFTIFYSKTTSPSFQKQLQGSISNPFFGRCSSSSAAWTTLASFYKYISSFWTLSSWSNALLSTIKRTLVTTQCAPKTLKKLPDYGGWRGWWRVWWQR